MCLTKCKCEFQLKWDMNFFVLLSCDESVPQNPMESKPTQLRQQQAEVCGVLRRALTADYNWVASAMSKLSHPIKRKGLAVDAG